MPATTNSPLFNNQFPLASASANRHRIKREMNKAYMRDLTVLANALIGAAPGGASGNTTRKRIKAAGSGEDGGGKRTIETETIINRNTTEADVTVLKELMAKVNRSPAYPRDKSGNGGNSYSPSV